MNWKRERQLIISIHTVVLSTADGHTRIKKYYSHTHTHSICDSDISLNILLPHQRVCECEICTQDSCFIVVVVVLEWLTHWARAPMRPLFTTQLNSNATTKAQPTWAKRVDLVTHIHTQIARKVSRPEGGWKLVIVVVVQWCSSRRDEVRDEHHHHSTHVCCLRVYDLSSLAFMRAPLLQSARERN